MLWRLAKHSSTDMKKFRIFNTIMLCLTGFMITGVFFNVIRKSLYRQGRHETTLSIGTADGSKMLLVELNAITADNDTLSLSGSHELKMITATGYGENASGFVRVPVKLEITWFSYDDNAFYKGSFALPETKLKAIIDTLTNYSIIVTTLKKGYCNVIVEYDFDHPFATFRAEKTAYPWPWEQDRKTEVIATNMRDTITPVFFKGSNSKLTSIDYSIYNGRYFNVSFYADDKSPLQLNNNRINHTFDAGIPEYLSLGTNIDATADFRHSLSIRFDMKEMTRTYEQQKQETNNFNLELHLTHKDSIKTIYLENNGKKAELKQYEVSYSTY